MLGAVSSLLLIGLFVIAAAPVWAESLEERIKALEEEQRANREELTQLKGEQVQMRDAALAAKAKLPSFSYRKGSGLSINAADKSWGLRFRSRFHYRLMFFDDDAIANSNFSQAQLALRRLRMRIGYFWNNGFYELDIEDNRGNGRSIEVQHGEFWIHFEKLNPFLPSLVIGPRVSGFFNKHDTNWSSSTGGLFDRSMFQDGAGIGAGTQNNGIGLLWNRVRLGGTESLFQVIVSNQGMTNLADQQRPKTDKHAVHIGFNTQPFKKSKSKWMKGIDFGIGYQLDRIHPDVDDDDPESRDFFQVRTTERQRLQLIRLGSMLEPESPRHYITPGFGWKIGPYWLRTAFAWNRGDLNEADGGGKVKGRMWRIAHELFIWSPKGFLTGSTSRAGTIQLFTGFERNDYHADDNGLRRCGPGGSSCESAYAYNFNVGAWYYIQRRLRVGIEYSRYTVNKIGGGADALEGVSRGGHDVDFNSVDLGITFDF
jgi:hypothetical protein